MDKKKWNNIKWYAQDIVPAAFYPAALFWWVVLYVVTYFLESSFKANWLLTFVGLFLFNILSVLYGRQLFLLDKKNKSKPQRKRHFVRFVLTLIICIFINCYYAYHTKFAVIVIYFLLSLVVLGGNYWLDKYRKR